MSVICLKQQSDSKLRLSTGSTSGERGPKAKSPASPEVAGGAHVIPKPAWAEFQEAGPQRGGLAGASSSPGLSVHQYPSPRRQDMGCSSSLGFPTPS